MEPDPVRRVRDLDLAAKSFGPAFAIGAGLQLAFTLARSSTSPAEIAARVRSDIARYYRESWMGAIAIIYAIKRGYEQAKLSRHAIVERLDEIVLQRPFEGVGQETAEDLEARGYKPK